MKRVIRLDGDFGLSTNSLPIARLFVSLIIVASQAARTKMSGIGTAASSRNLSLTEELERLEQSITLTLQGMLMSCCDRPDQG